MYVRMSPHLYAVRLVVVMKSKKELAPNGNLECGADGESPFFFAHGLPLHCVTLQHCHWLNRLNLPPKYYKNSRILLKIYTSHLPPSDLLNPHPSDPRSDNPKTNSDPRKSHVRCDPALSRCPCKKFLCASLSLHNKPFWHFPFQASGSLEEVQALPSPSARR